jgi:hypothetical protein
MATSTQKTRVNRRPAAPAADWSGARIAEAKYRQLKLAAVLRGVTVQTLVEQAIEEFLANHRELLPDLARSRCSKSNRESHAKRQNRE